MSVNSVFPTNPKVVFLDRVAIRAELRALRFEHEWIEYPTTAADRIVARLRGASIVITNRAQIGDAELSQLPDLKLIAVSATGYDSIDIAACRRYGVAVTNLQDWSTTSVAEHAFSLMLALRRQLMRYRALVEAGAWQQSEFYGLLQHPLPGDLYGSKLGIVGYGHLGKKIAAIGSAFGMQPLIAERKNSVLRENRTPFEDVLRQADVLCVTCPVKEATRGLIGPYELLLMKPSSVLINCARGGIVDDSALAEALRCGQIGGAGIDVLEQEPPRHGSPLLELKLPNLIVTPHMAFASEYSLRNLAEQLMSNIEAFAEGSPCNLIT